SYIPATAATTVTQTCFRGEDNVTDPVKVVCEHDRHEDRRKLKVACSYCPSLRLTSKYHLHWHVVADESSFSSSQSSSLLSSCGSFLTVLPVFLFIIIIL